MSYLRMNPPEDESNPVVTTVWIPVTLTTEQGQDDVITFAEKDLEEYDTLKELKDFIVELTYNNK